MPTLQLCKSCQDIKKNTDEQKKCEECTNKAKKHQRQIANWESYIESYNEKISKLKEHKTEQWWFWKKLFA